MIICSALSNCNGAVIDTINFPRALRRAMPQSARLSLAWGSNIHSNVGHLTPRSHFDSVQDK